MFHWKDKHFTASIKVKKAVAVVTDKDGNIHRMTRDPNVRRDHWLSGDRVDPYVSWKADDKIRYELQDKEYVTTDDGLLIPRCNISNVRIEEGEEYEEGFDWTDKGMKHWSALAWMMFFLVGLFCLGIVGAIGLLIAEAIY